MLQGGKGRARGRRANGQWEQTPGHLTRGLAHPRAGEGDGVGGRRGQCFAPSPRAPQPQPQGGPRPRCTLTPWAQPVVTSSLDGRALHTRTLPARGGCAGCRPLLHDPGEGTGHQEPLSLGEMEASGLGLCRAEPGVGRGQQGLSSKAPRDQGPGSRWGWTWRQGSVQRPCHRPPGRPRRSSCAHSPKPRETRATLHRSSGETEEVHAHPWVRAWRAPGRGQGSGRERRGPC